MREKVRFCVALCCSVVMVLLASCRYSLPDLPAELTKNMEAWRQASEKDERILNMNPYVKKYIKQEILKTSALGFDAALKDAYVNLYKGDRVVVAEFSVHPQDSVDSIWVKVAHSQEVQGWVRNKELVRSFVPTDSISQFIHLFSDTHASYFVFIFALFVGVYLLRAFMKNVFVDRTLLQYIVLIVQQTRTSKAVYLGASPRASVAMLQASKAYALLQGRDFVTPEDIKFVAPYVLQHRLILTAEAEMEGYSPVKVTQRLIDKVEVPK